ncbi:hypothetical protein [Phenylobacterium sp.]|jgi:hypothetical protein|uniref:hypothetical protein n=1 Tax=Phenylobacterium sp. TaxID=1871053 RepID=UPI002F93AE55
MAVLALLVAASALASTPNLILTENAEGTRWCAFDTVALASARADKDNALTVVNAWTAAGGIVDLKVVWGPQSYDWLVTDTYSLQGWTVVAVARDVGYASSDERLRQTYTRRAGRLELTGSNEVEQYHPKPAPYTDLRKAPFYAVLTRALAQKDLPDAGLCARPTRQVRR